MQIFFAFLRSNYAERIDNLIDDAPAYEIKDMSYIYANYDNNTKWTTDGIQQKFYITAYGDVLYKR